MQKIVDYASDNRTTLKEKYDLLVNYAISHTDIARSNLERKAQEDIRTMQAQQQGQGLKETPSGISGGVSRAMAMGNAMV